MAAKGSQDSVSQPKSSSTQVGHSLFTVTSEKTSSKGDGGAEGLCPGLDCTGCSDKTTGKGRFREGNRGSCLRLLLREEELTHPSDHLLHLRRPGSDLQCHQPGVGSWSPKLQFVLNVE